MVDLDEVAAFIAETGRMIVGVLGIPPMPGLDGWDEFGAELAAEIGEDVAMYLNSLAVMADAAQPILVES